MLLLEAMEITPPFFFFFLAYADGFPSAFTDFFLAWSLTVTRSVAKECKELGNE
jgi:hypothetical protein